MLMLSRRVGVRFTGDRKILKVGIETPEAAEAGLLLSDLQARVNKYAESGWAVEQMDLDGRTRFGMVLEE